MCLLYKVAHRKRIFYNNQETIFTENTQSPVATLLYFILLLSKLLPLTVQMYWALGKKVTIHQVTTKLSTFKIVLFPCHNHLLTAGTNDLTRWLLPRVIITGG